MAQQVYGWHDPRDARAVAPLEAALRERRTPLVPFDPAAPHPEGPAALVIFLSEQLLRSSWDQLDATIESWTGVIVPVALGRHNTDPPAALADLSWIEAQSEPIAAVAGRIALSVRTSPRWLLAWQEVRAGADRKRNGDSVVLLDQAGLERAEDTVRNRPRDLLPEVPPEVLALIHESRVAIGRRRRRRFAIALGTVLMLAAIAVVALVQRHSARVAEAQAKQALNHSEADRLSRLAELELEADPDLPVLLARRAYRLEPTADARESLRSALDAVPWHRSYRLPMAPVRLAASPSSPFIGIVSANGSVGLFDSRTGRHLATVPRPPGTRGTPVIAAEGDRLALAYDGGLVQVRRLDPAFRVVWTRRLPGFGDSSSLALAWAPRADRLIMAWRSRPALLLDLPSRRLTAIGGSGVAGPRAVAASERQHLIALASRHRIAILEAGTMRPCWSAPRSSPGALTLVFDDRHRTLVVARGGTYGLQLPIPQSCGAPREERPEMKAMVSIQGAAAATALAGGGVAVGGEAGDLSLVESPAIYSAGRFLADVSAVTGTGVTAGGDLVTTGADRWLRVWRGVEVPSYPVGPTVNLAFNEQFGRSDTRDTWRPMIASDESGSRVALGGSSNATFATLRTADLGDPIHSFFLTLGSSIRPAASSPCAALLFDGSATLYRCAGARLHDVWSRTYSESAGSLFQTALSADGRAVAVAGLGAIHLTRFPDGRGRRFETADLRTLDFDRNDDLFAISGDGSILEASADGGSRRIAVSLYGRRLAAAAVLPSGRQVLLACLDGEVLLAATANGQVQARFSVGTDLSDALGVRISPDGSLAVVVGRSGYRVVDLGRQRVIATGSEYDDHDLGAQPRDATFLGPKHSLVILRADEGLTELGLSRWRFLDGADLLRATAAAVPRRMGEAEAGELGIGPER